MLDTKIKKLWKKFQAEKNYVKNEYKQIDKPTNEDKMRLAGVCSGLKRKFKSEINIEIVKEILKENKDTIKNYKGNYFTSKILIQKLGQLTVFPTSFTLKQMKKNFNFNNKNHPNDLDNIIKNLKFSTEVDKYISKFSITDEELEIEIEKQKSKEIDKTKMRKKLQLKEQQELEKFLNHEIDLIENTELF